MSQSLAQQFLEKVMQEYREYLIKDLPKITRNVLEEISGLRGYKSEIKEISYFPESIVRRTDINFSASFKDESIIAIQKRNLYLTIR